jgi:hypothetical protein
VSDSQNNPPEIPEDLRGALDDWQVPEANSSFRARQRHAFLAAAKAGEPLTEEQATEQLDKWESEPAREEFRAELRERFLSAAAEFREDDSSDAAPAELRPVRGPQLRERSRAARPGMPKWAASILAVAAAGLLYFGLGGALPFGSEAPSSTGILDPSRQGWQTVNFVPGDEVLLDGTVKLTGEDERLAAAVTDGGCSLETGAENLSLIHYGEGVLLEFPPETELRFPLVSEGERGLVEIEVLRGGLRVATTEEFMGRVLVHTPHTTISLSGHSLGIDVYSEGTCICAGSGKAEIRPLKQFEGGPEQHDVGSATTRFIRPNGEVVSFPDGEVHHEKEMESIVELGDKYLY